MKRILPAFLALAACASPHEIQQPATVTFLGSEVGLETWDAVAVEGAHVHPLEGGVCLGMEKLLEGIAGTLEEPDRKAVRDLGRTMEGILTLAQGKPYGGEGKLVLGLRRYSPDGTHPSAAAFLELPALGAEEQQRTFEPPDLRGEYLSPGPSVEATLDRGRVRVRRTATNRMEFEVFAVFRPVRKRAEYERLQVVTRVEAVVER